MFPARRFREMPKPFAFDTKMKSIVKDLERREKKCYSIYGADVPLAGYRNLAITRILTQAAKEGWDYYPSATNCWYDFQEAATIFQKRFRNVSYSPEDITPVAGVACGWQLIHNSILDPGDEILVLEPAHYLWGPASQMYYLGAKVVQSPMIEESGWEPDFEKLHTLITEKTKAIVLDHPNNPTGHIYSAKARKVVIDIAGEHNIPVISDELYDLITYDGEEAPSMASESNDVPVIVLTSFSKFFAKPGWRIGYVAFHDPQGKITEIRNACDRIAKTYGHATTCIPLPIMVAATRVLMSSNRIPSEIANAQSIKTPMAEATQMVRELQKTRDYSLKRLGEIEGVSVVNPQASLYMFPRVEGIGKIWKTTEDFILDLLIEKQVLFVPGTKFGKDGQGHFRTLLLNKIQELEEVYNRLENFLKLRIHA